MTKMILRNIHLLKITSPTVTINMPITMATPATMAMAMPVKEGNSLLSVIRVIILQKEHIVNVMKRCFFRLYDIWLSQFLIMLVHF